MWPMERRETLGAVWGKKRAPALQQGQVGKPGLEVLLQKKAGQRWRQCWVV